MEHKWIGLSFWPLLPPSPLPFWTGTDENDDGDLDLIEWGLTLMRKGIKKGKEKRGRRRREKTLLLLL